MVSLLMLFMLVVRFSRRLLYDDFVVNADDAQFEEQIRKRAAFCALPRKDGAGTDISAFKGYVNSAYRIIKAKVRRNQTVYEYERWLYDNHYLIARYLKEELFYCLGKVPHVAGEPRIVAIARDMLKFSGYELSKRRVEKALSVCCELCPLTVAETDAFKTAVIYVLLEKIASMSRKCVYYRKLFRKAVRAKNVIKRYVNNNIYVYYTIKRNNKISAELKKYLTAGGTGYDNVDYVFSALIVQNNVLTAKLIGSLRAADDCTDTVYRYCMADKILSSDNVYANMDRATKRLYLKELGEQSSRVNADEITFAGKLLDYQRISGVHLGNILIDYKKELAEYCMDGTVYALDRKQPEKQKLYTVFNKVVNTLLAIAAGAFCGYVGFGTLGYYTAIYALWTTIASFIAFIPLSGQIAALVLKAAISPRPLASMSFEKVPDSASVLVVMPVYVSDGEELAAVCENFKSVAAVNKDENVKYCLLLDFKACAAPVDENDGELIAFLDRSYVGGDMGYAVRKRVKCGDKYGGYERKRGALECLNRSLVTGDFSDFYAYTPMEKPEFVIVIDADNTLNPGAVKKAVNVFLHPFNSCYDLLAFSPSTDMYSVKTPYSRRFLRSGGYELYPQYSDFFFNLTGKGIFTGKGIYRLQSFYGKLDGRIPENKVLSHDILEGALLNTGLAGVTVYEEAPTDFIADAKRTERWQRGDVQLLPFLKKGKIPNGDGGSLPSLYKTVIFDNAFSVLSPLNVLLLIVAGTVFGYPALAAGLTALLAGSAINVVAALLKIFNERFRYIAGDLCAEIRNAADAVLLLPFRALNGAKAFFMTAYKMARGKNLLKWKTFGSTLGRKSASETATAAAPSVAVWAGLTALSFISGGTAYFAAAGIASAAYYVVLYLCGRPDKGAARYSSALTEYAADIYSYFSDNLSDGLVADHLNVYPEEKKADYTSPTNIGFSMIAQIAAAELGLIDKEEARVRTEGILQRVTELEKWKGHLYNWYGLSDGKPLAPCYVSTVDSGNFIAALTVVKRYFGKKTAETAEKLIKDADFSALYDRRKNLFYIGYNKADDKADGHYDLLASEASLTSYLYSCMSGSVANWQALSRETFGVKGNVYASWNGSLFEYLMPALFLDYPNHSALNKSALRAVKAQIKSGCKGFWGISESGCYEFDDSGNYGYAPFGIESLALKSAPNSCVISPYGSFLALELCPGKVLANLGKLKKSGYYGRYGFYEAADFRKEARAVREFMAHHQGMCLTAIANALCDGVIRKLFMSDYAVRGGRALLAERVPRGYSGRKKKDVFLYRKSDDPHGVRVFRGVYARPQWIFLQSGDYRLSIDETGCGYSVYKDFLINKFRPDITGAYGGFFYVTDAETGEVFSATYAPLKKKGDYSVRSDGLTAVFSNGNKATMEVGCPGFFSGERRKLTVNNSSGKVKKYKIAFYSHFVLGTVDGDYSHPAFNNLFCESSSEKLQGGINAIKMRRRFLSKDDNLYFYALVKGLENFVPVTDRFSFLGRGRDESNPICLTASSAQSLGDVLEPCLGFTGEIIVPPGGKKEVELIMCAETDLKNEEKAAKRAAGLYFGEFVKEVPFVVSGKERQFSAEEAEYAGALFGRILYGAYTESALMHISYNREAFCEVSSGYEYKPLYLDYKKGNFDTLEKLVETVYSLNRRQAKVSLVIGYEEEDGYYEQVKREILSAVKKGIIGKEIFLKPKQSGQKFVYPQIAFEIFEGFKAEAKDKAAEPRPRCTAKRSPERVEEGVQYDYRTGEGGFAGGNYRIKPFGEATLLPYANVICMEKGGTVVTERGGGFTYFGNSRERKVTEWTNDPVKDCPSERLYIRTGGCTASLTEESSAEYLKGMAVYRTRTEGLETALREYTVLDGRAKIYSADVVNTTSATRDVEVLWDADFVLGWRRNDAFLKVEKGVGFAEIENVSTGMKAVLGAAGGTVEFCDNSRAVRQRLVRGASEGDEGGYKGVCLCAKIAFKTQPLSKKTVYFILAEDKNVIQSLTAENIPNEKERAMRYFAGLNPFTVRSADKALDILFNHSLLYQAASCRINGRCAFYQVGGAIGFRDQLQDMLALMYSSPQKVREHILLSAAHQYEEGDVQHWWHPPAFGVRTRISDDKLFLPYMTARYIEVTGDVGILTERVPFLRSRPLADYEKSRYENPVITDRSASLKEHIELALENAFATGEHGLLLIGGGDWNDALDEVGDGTKGESVWLTMFYYKVLNDLLATGVLDDSVKYAERADKLRQAVNACFVNGRYARLYTRDGVLLGAGTGDVLATDLICQAWAVMSGIADSEKAQTALDTARELVDCENGLIKLLWPPADESLYLGYLSKYPKGIRENGGQYTHGAVWYMIALALCGRKEEAYRLFKMINPVEKCSDRARAEKYKAEPYVLSGDVYSCQHAGRAGWSWYTGSAGWMYRFVLENLLGVKIRGNALVVDADGLPDALDGTVVTYRYGTSAYTIELIKADKDGFYLDGVSVSARSLALKDGVNRNIKVYIKRK